VAAARVASTGEEMADAGDAGGERGSMGQLVSRATGTARGTAGVNEPAAIKSNAFVVGDDAPPARFGSAQTSVCGHRDDDDEDNEEDEVDGDYYHRYRYYHYYHHYQ